MLRLMTAVLLISMLLVNCAPTPAPVEPTAVPPTKAEEPAAPAATEVPATEAPKPTPPEFIEIGASIPLTGKYGALGNMVLPGYEFAIEDINAAGGVYVKEYDAKIPLRLTYYDDESDPTKAVSKLETL
jgi:branched-chain amino acid transport system substrate-binding protein